MLYKTTVIKYSPLINLDIKEGFILTTGSAPVYLVTLTVSEHPDVFSEHKVKTHQSDPPPHTLRCPHGSTRTGVHRLSRFQGHFFLSPAPVVRSRTQISLCPRDTDGHHHRPQHQHHHQRRADGPVRTAGIQPAHLAGRCTVSIFYLKTLKMH